MLKLLKKYEEQEDREYKKDRYFLIDDPIDFIFKI